MAFLVHVALILLCSLGLVTCGTFHSLSANLLSGETVNFSQFSGKVVLVVNVASECGLTSRDYPQLNKLHKQFDSDKFVILAFPCNQFRGQEPGDSGVIQTFLKQHEVEFRVFEKCDVKGGNKSPVYQFLIKKTAEVPSWNFGKYLVAPNGEDVLYFGPNWTPDSLADRIQKLIDTKDEL